MVFCLTKKNQMKKIEMIIFEIVEGLNKKNFRPEKSFNELEIDSLDVYSIILKIEEKYKIKIKDKELDKIKSPKSLYSYLNKKNIHNW